MSYTMFSRIFNAGLGFLMAKREGRKTSSSSLEYSEAAEAVANIEELLTQILQSVPLRSLARFKCVSKHWNSLITNLRTRKNPKTLAFVSRETDSECFKSYPIDHIEIPSGWNPFKTFNDSLRDDPWPWFKIDFRNDDRPRLIIIQSCNGLFLCCVPPGRRRRREKGFIERIQHPGPGVYLVNPTTQKLWPVSSPTYCFSSLERERYALAFEPSKSPHYTLVCMMVKQIPSVKGESLKIHTYSSKTREWKHVADMPSYMSYCHPHEFDQGYSAGSVYCNGAVHWIRERKELSFNDQAGNFLRGESDVLHYFNISEERFRVVAATPPVPMVFKNIPLGVECRDRVHYLRTPVVFPRIYHRYLGECSGRLYLIEIFDICKTQFDVMEMEGDYCGWFVKYHVDLDPAPLPQRKLGPFVLLCLSRDDEEFGDSSNALLLHMPGKVVSYNLMNKNFKTSAEFVDEENTFFFGVRKYNFPYMESLACV